MIFTRYLAAHIYKSTLMVLFILVAMSLFLVFVQDVDLVGKGQFGAWQFAQYLLLKIPMMVVRFMPLAALLGAILSLGNLASSSELIAFQSSGLSLNSLVLTVIKIALLMSAFTFVIADFVAPVSETESKNIKQSGIHSRASVENRQGVWIKDDLNVLYVGQLYPDGNARNIEIFHMDSQGQLQKTTRANRAIMRNNAWELQEVKQSIISDVLISTLTHQSLVYEGALSQKLLESLVISADLMSSRDLYRYISFLRENQLNYDAELLIFWQKMYLPLGIMVMCLLAIPFVLGSQRNSNTGQRVIIGILLGLIFFIMNRLLIQLGEQIKLSAWFNALLPTLMFMLLTWYLIHRKVSNN